MKQKKKSIQELSTEKHERMMEGIAIWTSFYRNNPHRFVKEFLNIDLKLFQIFLLYSMMHNNYVIYVAARGQGKTWLTALFCVVRCILYPGTQIVIAAGIRSQANAVLEKVTKIFCKANDWGSVNLSNEIDWNETKVGQNDSQIQFKNGSYMIVVTANDNARSKRANIIIVDEARMVSLDVITTVLKRFLTSPRSPKYLNNPKYRHLQERNKEIYMSSAWYKNHWFYSKVRTFFANMLDSNKKYFVCSIPYQISIKEGLLIRNQVEDEISENEFDETKWGMEMESLFYGATDNSFFDYDILAGRRKLKDVFYPLELYNRKNMNIPKLEPFEVRVLSVDVALMASKKKTNDAASLMITRNLPVDDIKFNTNLVLAENYEGLKTEELGIIVMRTFYEYNCTELVIDCNGLGLGVADFITNNQYDSVTGKMYKGFKCCNDEEMAIRCKIKDPNEHFWSIKANTNLNNEICVLLRNGFANGRINIPVFEEDGIEYLRKTHKGFNKLDSISQALFKKTYVQTSLLINELINLNHEIKNEKIKIITKSGMRKDRYSSLAYNYWVVNEIEKKRKPKHRNDDLARMFASLSKKGKKYGIFN